MIFILTTILRVLILNIKCTSTLNLVCTFPLILSCSFRHSSFGRIFTILNFLVRETGIAGRRIAIIVALQNFLFWLSSSIRCSSSLIFIVLCMWKQFFNWNRICCYLPFLLLHKRSSIHPPHLPLPLHLILQANEDFRRHSRFSRGFLLGQ